MAHPAESARAANPLPVIVMMTLALALSIAAARRPDNITASADVRVIPKQVGEWKLYDTVKLDENTMRQIAADSFIDRRYINPAGQVVELLVVYRRYGRREFAHRPELCFPAAGFTITEKNKTTLPYAGRDVPAVALRATAANNGYRTNLSYFFASGKKTEEDFIQQQLWMAFERLIPNKNGWTFIRLQSPTVTTDADALAAQRDFMRAFAPAIEAAITTDGKPATPVARARPASAS